MPENLIDHAAVQYDKWQGTVAGDDIDMHSVGELIGPLVLTAPLERDRAVVLGDELIEALDHLAHTAVNVDRRARFGRRRPWDGTPCNGPLDRSVDEASREQSVPTVVRADEDLAARLLRPSTGVAGHALHDRLDGCSRPGRVEALHALDDVGEPERVVARAQTTCDLDDELPRRAWVGHWLGSVAAGWPKMDGPSGLGAIIRLSGSVVQRRDQHLRLCPRQDSNLRTRFRNRSFMCLGVHGGTATAHRRSW